MIAEKRKLFFSFLSAFTATLQSLSLRSLQFAAVAQYQCTD